jgi:hypothetical protein
MAVGSAPSNSIKSNTFAFRKQKTSKDSAHYVQFNDGTIVLGKAKPLGLGNLPKLYFQPTDNKFKINDSIFYLKDVYGIFRKGYFYSNFDHHGNVIRLAGGRRLSIHFFLKSGVAHVEYKKVSPNLTEINRTTTKEVIILAHKEDGTLKRIDTFDDLKELMKDCPYAVAILSRDANETKKDIRKNKYFLNDLVDMYNNGCK